jgi:hypothetical protein
LNGETFPFAVNPRDPGITMAIWGPGTAARSDDTRVVLDSGARPW